MFLATTALDAFWNKGDQILFLGEWCKLDKNQNAWKDIKNTILMVYPFDDPSIKRAGCEYCKKHEDKLLLNLHEVLNEIHGINKNLNYWKIIVGHWLQLYVTIIYERYICLKSALKKSPELNTILLDESCYVTPIDDLSFSQLSRTDLFNLQLYSQILRSLKFKFTTKMTKLEYLENIENIEKKTNKENILKSILRGIYNIYFFHCHGNKVICSGISSSFFSVIKMILYSKFSMIPMISTHSEYVKSIELDLSNRKKMITLLNNKNSSANEFEKVLIDLLPLNFPKVFLEGYSAVLDKFAKLRMKPKTILSDSSIKNSFQQLILSAEIVSNGGKIIIVQHGGGYGTYAVSQTRQWEIEIAHKFYSWGWVDKSLTNVCSIFQPWYTIRQNMFRKRKKRKAKNIQKLFIGSNYPRYPRRLESLPVGPQVRKYLDWQFTFFSALPKSVREKFIVRPYPVDFGWNQKQELQDNFPDLLIDNNRSYHEQLKLVDLVVIDNNQTVYLETFALNIPTIIFWDPIIWEINKSAQAFFKELSRVGVFHTGAQAAAQKVSQVHENPMKWWSTKEVQSAVEKFVKQFARSHKIFPLRIKDLKIMVKS